MRHCPFCRCPPYHSYSVHYSSNCFYTMLQKYMLKVLSPSDTHEHNNPNPVPLIRGLCHMTCWLLAAYQTLILCRQRLIQNFDIKNNSSFFCRITIIPYFCIVSREKSGDKKAFHALSFESKSPISQAEGWRQWYARNVYLYACGSAPYCSCIYGAGRLFRIHFCNGVWRYQIQDEQGQTPRLFVFKSNAESWEEIG